MDRETPVVTHVDYARPIIEFALLMSDRCCAFCGTKVLGVVVDALTEELAKRRAKEASNG